ERVIARLDSEALTGDPEPVERIADRRRVELRGAFGVLVGGHRCSQLEKLARVQAEYLLLVALGQPLDLADVRHDVVECRPRLGIDDRADARAFGAVQHPIDAYRLYEQLERVSSIQNGVEVEPS